jgi:murein DD-endopeptidase MepM/ murein hydrolase activator NlpD
MGAPSARFPLRPLCLLLASFALVARAEGPTPPAPAADDGEALDFGDLGEELGAAVGDDLVERALAMLDAHQPPRVRQRHWNNGPRAVPKARGTAQARAEALGIGGHLTTKRMLWTPPADELLHAVPGARPKSLLWPVVGGKWGRGFGFTRKARPELRHNGIDIGAKEGTPVRAAADGLVIYSDNTLSLLGNCVMILHPGGFTTLYAHNSRTTVQPGWYVKRGERIALVGQTGAAWGPHLHFELRDNGRWRDPEPLIVGYRDPSLSGPLVEIPGASTAAVQKDPEPAAKPAAAAKHEPVDKPEPAPVPEPVAKREPEPAAVPESEPEPAAKPIPQPAEIAVADSAPAPPLPFELGSLRVTRRLLRGELRPALPDEQAIGRRFSNLLRPVRGGAVQHAFEARKHPTLSLQGAPSAPVRAAADGVVVYAGQGLGQGHTLVILHRSGWLTVYGGVSEDAAAEVGARVLRGEWIARTDGDSALRFEWIVDGRPADPGPALVGE